MSRVIDNYFLLCLGSTRGWHSIRRCCLCARESTRPALKLCQADAHTQSELNCVPIGSDKLEEIVSFEVRHMPITPVSVEAMNGNECYR
jgi:hypothetical protein